MFWFSSELSVISKQFLIQSSRIKIVKVLLQLQNIYNINRRKCVGKFNVISVGLFWLHQVRAQRKYSKPPRPARFLRQCRAVQTETTAKRVYTYSSFYIFSIFMRVVELSLALGLVEGCFWLKKDEPEKRTTVSRPPVRLKTAPRGNPKVSFPKKGGLFLWITN